MGSVTYLVGIDDEERKRLLVIVREGKDEKGVIKGNSIYFTDDAYFEHGLRGNGKCRDMRIYHLSDGTIEPYFNGVSLSHITPPIWLQSM
ncbi:leucine--tRNA ligase, cytoplasmic [Tanacetum coccineum]